MRPVLVLRAGALGDILLLRRAVAALRRAGRPVGLLAPAGPGSVLVGPGLCEVDRLLAWDRAEMASLLAEGGVPAGPLQDELSAFDLALAYTRSASLVENLGALVPKVIAHDPQPPPAGGHASAWLASPLVPLGFRVGGEPPVLSPAPEDREGARPFIERLPARFLAIHPGSGSPAKNWPAGRFAALVEAWRSGEDWLLIGGPADAATTALLRLHAGAVVASGLAPRTLGAILAHAAAYVGNDSGVSHLAAAWGAPTVALFGPTEPEVWGPVGPRVRVVRAESGSMDGISVDDVIAAATELAEG